MPPAANLALFAVTALAILLVPGPAVAYIVTRSIDQGRTAGLVSVLGVHSGSVVHVLAAAFGLSAVLASSATAFTVVKLVGAAYLVFIGITTLLRRGDDEVSTERLPRTLRRIYVQGVVVNVLNPKTALFFLAFLPQFIEPGAAGTVSQSVVLGLLFIALGMLSDSAYALLAARLGGWLKGRAAFARRQRKVSGGAFIAMGAVAAIAGKD